MTRIGLEVNPTKCEVINSSVAEGQQTTIMERLHQLIPGAAVLTDTDEMVLRVPQTSSAAEKALVKKKEELDCLISRLQHLDSLLPPPPLPLAAQTTIPAQGCPRVPTTGSTEPAGHKPQVGSPRTNQRLLRRS